ncbi:short-chain dehydrogenase [Azorhizobium oxalatiphilum]|uniref:Short-chain dehydrogenase n=1 Tax=Azorhizobium oxalatiphilum TaxID=980631 RepID=A0A917BXP2_9HYPH|nr:NnrS family protein [Azorhizobium oxalatiphilum]GGF60768.1 short-chain dehydrogenase [Azorhizobium oxalatiphilum]
MARTAQTQRAYTGPALWSRGFRPFFLAAGIWAALAIAIWPAILMGRVTLPTAFGPVDWHVHEMLFGYGAAVVAGFLLTAIPNWTGRLPVAGASLAALAGLWLAGRIAVLMSGSIGWTGALLIDSAFLLAFALVTAREIVAGKNWRNAKVVGIVLMLAIANIAFHLEAAWTGSATFAARAGIGLLVLLILLVGGRVVPSFTGNWLARQGLPARPVPFGRPDGAILLLAAAALLVWIAHPEGPLTGTLLLCAGMANLWRLARWQGWRTLSDPLVLVLHVGFALTAIGFLAAAAHAFAPSMVPAALGLHIWAIGGIGGMTLAIMTRATLGHTGRALHASRLTVLIYLAIAAALLTRAVAALPVPHQMPLIHLSATLWVIAFVLFLMSYGRMLYRRS